MNIETTSRTSFELVAAAVDDIDFYKQSKDRNHLTRARMKLDRALQADRSYLQAHFYSGVVDDLLGRTQAAVQSLRSVLAAIPDTNIEGKRQARYNLAVATYHGYSHRFLEIAEKEFLEVLNGAEDLLVRCLAEAGLAQAYAMWEIPHDPDQVNSVEQRRIQEKFTQSQGRFENARDLLRRLSEENVPESTRREIEGSIWNAYGMSFMYISDYQQKDRFERLNKAQQALVKADLLIPSDWANTCDLASCHMRLGYWLTEVDKKREHLLEARRLLQEVVSSLRPGYPFARYEIARAWRIEGEFAKALELFREVKSIQPEQRDVGDLRIEREIRLANERSTDYP